MFVVYKIIIFSMILKIVNCKEPNQLQPGDYKNLITSIYERYKYDVSGVVLAATFVNQSK